MAKFNEPDNTTINLISNGTDIIGDIKSNGDIRIDGSLTGNLNTKGKVVIGTTGKVKGEVICKNSEVAGILKDKIIEIYFEKFLKLGNKSLLQVFMFGISDDRHYTCYSLGWRKT